MVDIPGNSSTSVSLDVGESIVNTLETVGDRDWFRLELDAGQSITVLLQAITLGDPYLRIRDAAGNIIYENDDIQLGRVLDSQISFTANFSGTYYIEVGSYADQYAGDYNLSVSPYSPPPLWTNDEIADQLVSGYWAGDTHRFDAGQGDTITVNITALTPAGQTLAREALALWSDIIGIDFAEVATGGQITFDDNEDGAFSDGSWANGFITATHVNVSTDWLNSYGTGLNSYSFQTYIHEIGHALGLGHAGNYNETARYPYDVLFENDSWASTVMSYFDQNENTYFAGQGFTVNFLGTPMVADIIAVGELYGLSTTTRTGNTTYGFNSNAGRAVYDADLYPTLSYTVFDSGGIDTLDYSGFSANQRIDLDPEAFSSVGGRRGNVTIARGVTIENAIGGSGNDLVLGNGANNRLEGRAGDDRLDGGAGNDVLDGGFGDDTATYARAIAGVTASLALSGAQNTVAAGMDTLIDIENLVGSRFADTLTGNASANLLDGGDGDDILDGGRGDDTLDGGDGSDTASFASADAGVTVSLAAGGRQNTGAGSDLLNSIENLVGSEFDDRLTAGTSDSVLDGRGGRDVLQGGAGLDRLLGGSGDDDLYGDGGDDELEGGAGFDRLYGGAGNDRYIIDDAADEIAELAGQGSDTVLASRTYVLENNLEDLRLTGTGGIWGYGNAAANVIVGNSAGNRLYGRNGDDRLFGEAGNDRFYGGDGLDRIYGGAGDDIYIVRDSSDYIYENAGEGHDRVYSTVSHVLRANVEMLRLQGGLAIDGHGSDEDNIIYGNSAENKINGWGGDDRLFGEGGNDRLYGTEGDDRLFGGAGDDRLDGGSGYDRIYGGAGDDTYIVRDSTDYAYENAGEGVDRVYSTITHVLRENVEELYLQGSGAIRGYGNDDANTIVGNGAANRLYGEGGDDRLYGRQGGDRLYGREGDDLLDGGAGLDLLYGGTGADDFLFRGGDFAGAVFAGADRILDFSQAEGDRIHLSTVDADRSLSGDQAFDFVGTDAFSGTAGELRFEQVSGNTYVSGDTDGDGIADFMIRIDGLHTLESGDFIF